jgi:DNA-binding CsgD family transcriptional regulator
LPFGQTDARRLGRLLPHLQRAMLLRQRLGDGAGTVGLAALDALAEGAVICDAAGRIVHANASAEAAASSMAGVVLGHSGHGIGTLHAREGRQLAGLIANAAGGGPGGGMAISGADTARLLVLVTPLPPSLAGDSGHALVVMRREDARPTVDGATLGRIFGLTPAEAALALALLSGQSLASIAAERGVSENTARSQLSQVLRKSGAANQRDLVRLLSLVPAVRRPAAPGPDDQRPVGPPGGSAPSTRQGRGIAPALVLSGS